MTWDFKEFFVSCRFPVVALVICSLLAIVGCESEPEVEPVDPSLPPPPTAQQIAQKIVADAQLDMPIPVGNGRFPASVKSAMLGILQSAKTEHSATPVGKKALEHVVGRIEKRIRDFDNVEAWQYTMVFIEAHEIFEPNSGNYGSLKDEVYTQLMKPVVKITGLPVINDRQLILLTFYLPLTDKRYKEKVQIGDEVHGLRVVDIFGQNRGVTLEYLETGERFVAFMQSAK